jgi:hypothetical protein
MSSDEYKSLNTVAQDGFVDALYRDVLHRYADGGGELFWPALRLRGRYSPVTITHLPGR